MPAASRRRRVERDLACVHGGARPPWRARACVIRATPDHSDQRHRTASGRAGYPVRDAPHRPRRPDQALPRRGHRARRPDPRHRARDRRARRRQRRRQEHAPQDPARAASSRPSGDGAGHRPRRPARRARPIRQFVGYMPEHDCLPPDASATDFVSHMARMSGLPRIGGPRADRRGPPPRRAVRGALPGDRRLLDGHEAAGQARPGARPRPAAAAPRRADERPRPGRPRRDARARPADRHRVRDRRHRRQPPPRRDRAGLRLPRRDRRRAAAARRAARHLHRAHRGRSRSRSRRARTPLAAALVARGLEVVVDGRRVLVAFADERTYDLVRDAVADLGLPLVRLEQRRHRLEDLFRDEVPAA